MKSRYRWQTAFAAIVIFSFGFSERATGQSCTGDCDGDGSVRISELVLTVNIALDRVSADACPTVDRGVESSLNIEELIAGVSNATHGCPDQEEFVARASDFECLTNWERVRRFRITNALGHLDETLAVARREIAPPYPPGTIIQLVPGEALVKRGGRFDPENGNWEYLVINPNSGRTKITARGTDEVINIGVPCVTCHFAARAADFICEGANGCPPRGPLTIEVIDFLQENDPRCP